MPSEDISPSLPEESLKVASIQVNQFIQLVNQTNHFPDPSTFAAYSPEDKAWIKQRTEVEQKARHRWTERLIEGEQEIRLKMIERRSAERLQLQKVSGLIIVLGLGGSVALLWSNHISAGIGLLAILLGVPTGAGAVGRIVTSLQRKNSK
jgi:hypothetical protein